MSMQHSPLEIRNFIHDLSDIPASDELVNTDVHAQVMLTAFPSQKIELEQDAPVRALVREALRFRKEADVNALCLVHYVLRWEQNGNIMTTPLLLFPLEWSVTRPANRLQLLADETFELNPYVKRILREYANATIEWEKLTADETLERIKELLQERSFSWTIEECLFIGNFHYHRYHILRELEGIDRSNDAGVLINELLGNGKTEPVALHLGTDLLTPADPDQLNVFRTFERHNTVVQGPPGTGKSQVITNLLGKLLRSRLSTLVVSEKRVALEVLVKKLAALELDRFTFVVHSQTRSKDLIAQLKATWMFLENLTPERERELKLSEQRLAQLQLLLDRLNSPALIGGVSYYRFRELQRETPFNEHLAFRSDVPEISEWLKHRAGVQRIQDDLAQLNILGTFKPAFFRKTDGDVAIKTLLEQWNALKTTLNIAQWKDIRFMYEALGRCRLIENEWYKPYSRLLEKPAAWKKFERNRLRFTEIASTYELAKAELTLWKQWPSATQIASFEQDASFWKRRQRNKQLKVLLNDPSVDLATAVKQWKAFEQLHTEKTSLESYFSELGLPANVAQLEAVMEFAKNLQKEHDGVLSTLAQWTQEQRKTLLNAQVAIEQFVREARQIVDFQDEDFPEEIFFQQLKAVEKMLPVWQEIAVLPLNVLRLTTTASDWETAQAQVLFSNWKLTEALFPELARFDGNVLRERIEQLIAEQDQENAFFARELVRQLKQRFDANEALLMKTPQKSTPEEKERRARLKRGKAQLVKEFGKSRTHASIRELLDSDAGVWIQDLIPIWLATPTQVADHFPLKPEVFDVVIFDEASQLPLPNAFGALYRSKRALIAGDEQQMSPTSYFGKNWSGHDLLHQAQFYFTGAGLKHHYRSTHTDLIAFSNRHFYRNELLVYPSPDNRKVVFGHLVSGGRFIERSNSEEAKALAAFLKTVDWSKRIGIVAFSEEQLKTVWNACDAETRERISTGQEENTVFFKPLEQVQGDEADILVVSMGYAKNENGEFHQRFGPLNQANGFKRLNVLLTRAGEQLHFFRSVTAEDFGVSANESVNLLRKFLHELDKEHSETALVFPHELTPEQLKGNEIHFSGITGKLQQAEELTTFHRVMVKRGWKIAYA